MFLRLVKHHDLTIYGVEVQLHAYFILARDRSKQLALHPSRLTLRRKSSPYPSDTRLAGPQNRSRRFSFIHSIGMCRMRLLAVLRSFFHSSLLHTLSFHPLLPPSLPSSIASSCHLFLGLPLRVRTCKEDKNRVLESADNESQISVTRSA